MKKSYVDSFSTTILAQIGLYNAPIWAGYLFVSLDDGENNDWIDEHPFSEDRFGDLVCWSAGASSL